MVNEHIKGHITDIDQYGIMHIVASVPSLDRALRKEYEECEIMLADGRRISPEQRRKIYALIGEIAEYIEGFRTKETIEETKETMKWSFILERMEDLERRLFSLSDCDMTTASAFITYLIDFIIRQDIPTGINLREHCEDIQRYVYACLVNKKCCVCGQKAQLHHCEGSRVGMGNDRKQVSHLGRMALPVCECHHTEAHADEQAFLDKYHLEPVAIDEKICKVYKLKK